MRPRSSLPLVCSTITIFDAFTFVTNITIGMIQLGFHFTLLLALCLAVAAHPATNVIVAEHEASYKHSRRFHRARIYKPRYENGQHHPGYPTATYDDGHFDLTYPTAPHTNEQYAAPSQSPSVPQGSAGSINTADDQHHPGYLDATYDNVQVHERPTTYNEKYVPQTADQASPSSNSPVAVKTLVVAIAELPTLSTPLATSSPTTTTATSGTPEIPALTTTTASAEGAPPGILHVPAAAIAPIDLTTATTALFGATGSATGILRAAIPAGTTVSTSIVGLAVPTSATTATTGTTSGDTAAATATSTATGTLPTTANIAGGVKQPQDDDPIYRVGRSRQKRIDVGQYYPDLRFDNKYHPGKSQEKRFDEGQHLPDPEFEDSQHHPNSNNGEHHLRKGSQKLSNDDRYYPSSIYGDDGKYHSGKRSNRHIPVA